MRRRGELVRLIKGAKRVLPSPYAQACLPNVSLAPEQLDWLQRKLRQWEDELADLDEADNAEHRRTAMRGIGVYVLPWEGGGE